jgi:ADP-ribose pyrophosphatase
VRDADRDGHLRWAETGRRRLARLSVFDIWAARRVSPAGQDGEFCVIEAPDWVTVVPVLRGPDGAERYLMVRQFRQGAGMVTTEFPAGLVDPGEEPRRTAARELLEETGRSAGRLTLLGRVAPNPAFMTNWCHVFLAEDLAAPGPADGGVGHDELELLEAREVEAAELARDIGTGEFVNSLVLVAWSMYRDHAGGKGRGADRN